VPEKGSVFSWREVYSPPNFEATLDLSQLITYIVSLFVICNPISTFPAFLTMTHGRTLEERRRIGLVASGAVAIILVTVTWIGAPFLRFMGISVPAFQLAGGVIIFLLALSMLKAEPNRMKQATEDEKEARTKESIAVVPLAIPIMAGPGAISTVIVSVNTHPGPLNQFYFSICAVCVAAMMGLLLYFAHPLEKLFGRSGINIITRIAGLLLAAIAAQTISRGIIGLFPTLG
jgi:multiple antibiotic resistance protein